MAKHSRGKQKKTPLARYTAIALIAVAAVCTLLEALGIDVSGSINALLGGSSKKCSETVSVDFIDVGQGDCILVQSDKGNMLIDCGEAEQADKVINYIKSQNITELDYVVATHPHSDHMGAMSSVISNFKVDNVIMPELPDKDVPTSRFFEKFLDACDKANLRITNAETGMKIDLGEACADVIAPPKSCNGANDYSVGIVLTHGENTFVFTGDAEKAGEENMIKSGLLKDCDVYKAGHHGSNTSSSDELLDVIKPEYAVIMCGVNNSYGHPQDGALKRITKYTGKDNIYRTDLLGTIVFKSDGENLAVTSER